MIDRPSPSRKQAEAESSEVEPELEPELEPVADETGEPLEAGVSDRERAKEEDPARVSWWPESAGRSRP